jgi:hypothetical protein
MEEGKLTTTDTNSSNTGSAHPPKYRSRNEDPFLSSSDDSTSSFIDLEESESSEIDEINKFYPSLLIQEEVVQVYVAFCGRITALNLPRGCRLVTIEDILFDMYGLHPEEVILRIDGKIPKVNYKLNQMTFINVHLKIRGGMQKKKKPSAEPPQTEESMDKGTRKRAKLILKKDPQDRSDEDFDLLEEFERYHPKQIEEILLEVKAEEIELTKLECNYPTPKKGNVERDNNKVKTSNFVQSAKKAWEGQTNVLADVSEKCINKEQPDFKLKVAPLSIPFVADDKFEMVNFKYFLPGKYFLFFKDIQWVNGRLPKFAVRYINNISSMPSTQVNTANMFVLLFKEQDNIDYIRNMITDQIVEYKKNVLGYYLAVQADMVSSDIFRSFKIVNDARRQNLENLKDDSPFGINFKNIYSFCKEKVKDAINDVSKMTIDKLENSPLAKKCEQYKKQIGEAYISVLTSKNTKEETIVPGVSEQVQKIPIEDLMELKFEDFIPEEEIQIPIEDLKFEDFVPEQETHDTKIIQHEQQIILADIEDKGKLEKFDSNVDIVQEQKVKLVESNSNVDIVKKCSEEVKKEEAIARTGKSQKKTKKKQQNTKGNNLMAIFPSHPLISAWIEEIIKIFPGGSYLVGWIDDYVHGSSHRMTWHEKTMKFNFFQRLKLHRDHNEFECSLSQDYNSYAQSEKLLPETAVFQAQMLKHGSFLESVTLPIVQPDVREYYPFEHIGNTKVALNQKRQKIKFYPLLFPATNLVTYDNTFENFQATVLLRLLVPKTNGPVQGEWNKIIERVDIFSFDYKPDLGTWFKTLNPYQRSQVLRHASALEEGSIIDTRTKVFLKTRELLKKSSKGYGRLIFNVSTKYLLLLGDFISQLSSALVKNLFPPIPIFSISKDIAFFYSSKFIDRDLNTFVNHAMNAPFGKYVLVLGDDTAIINRDAVGEDRYVETDYSAFDSTQVKGGALDLFPHFLEKMGFPVQKQIYQDMYNENIDWRHTSGKRIEMPPEYNKPPWRMSGEPGTSVANSHVNIYATKAVLEGTSTYEKLGLVVKRKCSNKFDITFLKGIWLHSASAGRWFWVRLPSFILKFKSFTEPKSIYPKSWTIERCEQQLLYSQWLGFGYLKNNWFYKELDTIIKNLCPLASTVELTEEYKVYSEEKFWIEDVEFDTMLLNRYNITRYESEEFLSDLREKIVSLPTIYQSTFCDKLMVDT